VLVIEDDVALREAALLSLADDGFATAGAANGLEAIDYLTRSAKPSAIVLDLVMPIMTGWDVLSWLAGRPDLFDVPVIVISASEDHDRARRLHPVWYSLSKPFSLDLLLWALGRVCSKRRAGPA
jgi:two-component system, response regulator, stage 0 sporulation protein F